MKLLLSGLNDGLLVRGASVVVLGTRAVLVGLDDAPADERHGEWLACPVGEEWPDSWTGTESSTRSVRADECEVDLRDPLGQAVALLWLAERTIDKDRRQSGSSPDHVPPMIGAVWHWHRAMKAWMLTGLGWSTTFDIADVPALAGVTDPAEALLHVCRHVAGRQVLNRATRDRVHPLGRDCSSCALSHVHDIYGGKLGCPVVNAGGARETGKAQEVEAWRAAATFDNDGFPTATPGPCPMWFDGAE